ncbi:PAS domain-containing sensor histidine kinase [Massilia sp. IC2-278]|uniref:PAS domain-containing sensor histidine kinase n=1 Tax=Massilia sp. IC2-278 TaxID=2887200 RepID=UPI001E2F90C5|nr:PAS domain-containing sensor histidine kinase [Massilia sp. IC2-278]MCC2959582.1 PAS domain-containing sensor histidine kinase [Massilia sp. IC2-278]
MSDMLSSQYDPVDARAFEAFILDRTDQYGVVFYDAALQITGWSAGAMAITGWAPEQVIGQPFAMLFVPDDITVGLPEHEAHTAAVIGSAENERWHTRRDGSWFWSSGMSFPLRREAERIVSFVKVFRDVTHLRARTKALENTVQEFREREGEHSRVIATVAHELRNPLAPIRTASELMKRLPDQEGQFARPLAVIERQVAFLGKLVEDLVDVTRASSGKMRMAYCRIELQAYLNEILEPAHVVAAAKGVALHLLQPGVPITIEADAQRLQQVVLNLVNNAIKFTPTGGTIWLTVTLDQTHFVLYVRDTGRGIAADILPKIFDIFTQASNETTERGSGLGIGLAVVKDIVTQHEGTVEVRSDGAGRGSEFVVRIPRKRPHGAEPEPLPHPGAPAA